jgi:hypothetical protein
MGCPHAAEATETAAPEATEASTAAPTPIAGTPTHGYAATREAAMAAFAKSWRRERLRARNLPNKAATSLHLASTVQRARPRPGALEAVTR